MVCYYRFFDLILMTKRVEKLGPHFNCSYCGQQLNASKMRRHLVNYHRFLDSIATKTITEDKETNRSKLMCKICGAHVTCLTNHLMNTHSYKR